MENTAKVKSVSEILADLSVLYVKTRNYHWNVTGSQFFVLHEQFEELYNELAGDIDEVAERIRTLGEMAPGTMKEFLELSTLSEEPGQYPEGSEMVKNIVSDLETITTKLNSTAEKYQDEKGDEISAGMFYGIVEKYQKKIWMFKAYLG